MRYLAQQQREVLASPLAVSSQRIMVRAAPPVTGDHNEMRVVWSPR